MKLSYRITFTAIATAVCVALFVRLVPMLDNTSTWGIPSGLAYLGVAVSVLLMFGVPVYVWVASRPARDRSPSSR